VADEEFGDENRNCQEERQSGESGQVRATTRGAVNTVYDHHAMYAAGKVGWESPVPDPVRERRLLVQCFFQVWGVKRIRR
jgi:hypothetical protein